MNRRERLERMLELRRSKVEACRAAAGHLQGQVDDAVSALDAAAEQLRLCAKRGSPERVLYP